MGLSMLQAGTADNVCVLCLVQTRWWQEAQMYDAQDSRPYLAYIRVLRYLDGSLESKFLQWVSECTEAAQFFICLRCCKESCTTSGQAGGLIT